MKKVDILGINPGLFVGSEVLKLFELTDETDTSKLTLLCRLFLPHSPRKKNLAAKIQKEVFVEIILKSFLLVASTEMGDKTQLLALILASRFKKPWTIMAGILVATILNHAIASYFGVWISKNIDPTYLKYALIVVFVGFAVWILIPDKEDELQSNPRFGAFLTTLITFFIAEMGDKTQLSTVALSAEYQNVLLVTIGTTFGMIFSDGLAVFLGEKITKVVSMRWIHIFSSLLYLLFAIKIYFSP